MAQCAIGGMESQGENMEAREHLGGHCGGPSRGQGSFTEGGGHGFEEIGSLGDGSRMAQ